MDSTDQFNILRFLTHFIKCLRLLVINRKTNHFNFFSKEVFKNPLEKI